MGQPRDEQGAELRDQDETRPPRKYRVVLRDDPGDATPPGFIVNLARQLFVGSVEEALVIARRVEDEGSAIAGVYTYEIAETKVVQAHTMARRQEHSLVCSMEADV